MSDIDLTEAHKAALDAAESVRPGLFAVGDIAANAAARAVAASAPLIEAAVREQIARAVEVQQGVLGLDRASVRTAARIARGEQP